MVVLQAPDNGQSGPNQQFRTLPTSPVPHLLHANTPPSEEETGSIQAAIYAADAEIRSFRDGQGSTSDSRLEALQRFIQLHRSLLSARRCVPPEIWALIFELCLSTEYTRDCKDSLTIIQISLVCRLWKAAALSHPQLWVHIPSLTLNKRRGSRVLHSIHLADEILARSSQMPISIAISASFQEHKSHPVSDILVAHCNRWKHAIIYSTAILIQALEISGKLPLLHTLDLNVDNLRASPDVVTVFREAPSLRVVRITGMWPVKIELPWNQIEEYTENTANLVGLPHIMHSAKNLRQLSYSTFNFPVASLAFPVTSSASPQTTFNQLTSLRLHYHEYGRDPSHLLDSLTLPAVQYIHMSNSRGERVRGLIGLIRRSKCKLYKLVLLTSSLIPGELTELLLLTPTLEELEINHLPTQDLERLIQPTTIPHLRSLDIHRTSATSCSEASAPNKAAFSALAHCRCSLEQLWPLKGDSPSSGGLKVVFRSPEDTATLQAVLEMI